MLGTIFTIVEIKRGIQSVHYIGLPTPYHTQGGDENCPESARFAVFPYTLTLPLIVEVCFIHHNSKAGAQISGLFYTAGLLTFED